MGLGHFWCICLCPLMALSRFASHLPSTWKLARCPYPDPIMYGQGAPTLTLSCTGKVPLPRPYHVRLD